VTTINDLVNVALDGWAKLIGLTAEGAVEGDNPWGAYDLLSHTEKLNESRTLDPTGLTTFMMLRGLVERYLKDVTFDAYSLILDPRSIGARLRPMKALKDVLESTEVVQLIADFQALLRGAAGQYGVRPGEPTDALENLLTDKFDLAYVRHDALLSINNLEAHQFVQGTPEGAAVKYSPQVFEFWNMNSLLLAMRAQRVSGITLCLIRDPEEALHSYFVFAIRNGLTLTILTDREKVPHPAHNRMSRRPDRMLSRRAARNWFPYHLIGLREQKDEDGEVKQISANVRTQLVPINIEAVPLKDIRDLGPEEFVWLTLLFDLIRDKFWNQNHLLSELSYTGQMIVEPAALVGAEGALVKDGLYKPLELPKLVKESVNEASAKPDAWDMDPTHFNAWMVERYGPQVPDEVLNPVGELGQLQLAARTQEFFPVVLDAWGHELTHRSKFETMSAITFGTTEQLQKDRIWVGRMNQMKVIQKLAGAEFEKEKDDIILWYRAAITKNREALLDACARGELILPSWRAARMGGHSMESEEETESRTSRMKEFNALEQSVGNRWSKAFDRYSFSKPKFRIETKREPPVSARKGSWESAMRWQKAEQRARITFCADRTDIAASVFSVIHPNCPEALSILTGVKMEDLPWPLRHWYDDEPYHGNSILNRLDPEDWVLENPWLTCHHRATGICFDIGVALSKHALHARRKKLGLPRKDYVEKKDDDE